MPPSIRVTVLDSTGRDSDRVWDGLARVRRLASRGAFVTNSSMCKPDKCRYGKRRAEETGGCVYAEGVVYGTDRDAGGTGVFYS